MGIIQYIYKYRKEWNCRRPYQSEQERDAWLALDKANAYYQDGGRYIYEGRAYTLRRYINKDAHGDVVEIAQFVGIDGYNLFTDPARLGTFLPCVASEGQEITRF